MLTRFYKLITITQNREIWIDVLKGVGILLVLLGHCNTPFDKYIYGFHMPLFFLISGYLFKSKKPIIPYFRKLLKRYIVPYFVLAFCMLVIVMVTQKKYALILHYIIGILYSRGSMQWMPMCSPLWFLTCLFCALFIFNVILHVNNRWLQYILIVLSCLVSYYLYLINCFKLVWNLDTALMAVGFLGIGMYCSRKKEVLFENKQWALFSIICFVIGMIAIHFNVMVDFDSNNTAI